MTEHHKPGKILFVNPPCYSGVVEASGTWIPLALVYLAGCAREAGLEAEIYDAMAKGDDYQQIERRLRDSDADYIAVGAVTATIDDAIKVLDLAKKVRPECVTILGGIHPTFMYEEVLAGSDAVDYIVVGEGETTLRLLLENLHAGGDPATVAGLVFRRSGKIVVTGRHDVTAELDALPAAWDLLDWSAYTYHAIPGSRFGAVSSSRGCERDHAFFSQKTFSGRSWRGRDPRKVADELAYLYQAYGVNVVMLTDEHPTRSRERWEALLDELIARELLVNLLIETRGEDIIRDQDILCKYRRAGVVYVSCGAESPGHSLCLRPGVAEPAAMKLVFDLLRDQDIVSEGRFMLGLPDETPATVKRTLELAREINPDIANFLTYTPWPYAENFAAIEPFVKVRDYRKYSLVETVVKPRVMSMPQVDLAVAECYRRFYMGKIIDFMTLKAGFRRDFLIEVTRQFMISPFVVKKLGIGLFGAIPAKIGEMVSRDK